MLGTYYKMPDLLPINLPMDYNKERFTVLKQLLIYVPLSSS